jgi:hypothetical protein
MKHLNIGSRNKALGPTSNKNGSDQLQEQRIVVRFCSIDFKSKNDIFEKGLTTGVLYMLTMVYKGTK